MPTPYERSIVIGCHSSLAVASRSLVRGAGWWRTLLVRLSLAAVSILLPSVAVATVFLNGDFIQLPIDNDGQPGRFMADGDASGAKYNSAGTGGASGQDFWVFGSPVYNYTIAIGGSNFRSNGGGWMVAPTVTDTSSGSTNSATVIGQPFAGLSFSRLVAFGDGDQFVRITDMLTNTSGGPLAQVATLDNTDPDQDFPNFETNNDVVSAQIPKDLALATGTSSGLTVGFGSASASRVVDFSGFDNSNPYPIIASPSDPNGAPGDIGMNIAFNYGTLAAGESKAATWFIVFAPNKAGAISTYALATGCSNGVLDPGEACDDGNVTPGDGCDSACRIEPCYACAGEPSACSPIPDGSPCDDGVFCNGTDTCSGSTCSIHTGDPCGSFGECNNVCNEMAENCQAPAGAACSDDGNVCTDDICDGAGTCGHPNNAFVPCDDGLFCNGADACLGGGCAVHDGDPCVSIECSTICHEMAATCAPDAAGTPCSSDFNVCTDDQCNGAGACAHPAKPNGTSCPDDGNACTNDACNGSGTCAHPALPNGTACDDANACTHTDACQSGTCVGADPVVCTAPLCYEPGFCDPATGICTTCPAGYAPANGGCQKSYAIGFGLLDNLTSFCDGTGVNRYNDCSSIPFGFHWTDSGDESVGDVAQIGIELGSGLSCTTADHVVSLNDVPIGVYASTAAGACGCVPPRVVKTFVDLDPSAYVKGGSNAVSISTDDCAGLSADAGGHYAVVTVTYADSGFALALHGGCHPAIKSTLRYRDSADDAKDRLKWKWRKGDEVAHSEFGDPTASADYDLCVFAETGGSPSLLLGAHVPANPTAWTPVGNTRYKYFDPAGAADGIKGILLRSGEAGTARLLVKGQGTPLADPSLPLAAATSGIRVQLTNQSNAACWETEFPLSGITADDRNIKATLK